MAEDPGLRPEKILELEFEYAHATAMQAQNDRTVMVNLYLLLVGAVGSIFLAVPAFSSGRSLQIPPETMSVLFFLLSAIGFLTLLKLMRLRQAWQDSALAMNQIKSYYLQQFPELGRAFHWRADTLPSPSKPWSITFILSLMVALIDSVALVGGVQLLEVRTGAAQIVLDLIVFAFAMVAQGLVYFAWLGSGESERLSVPSLAQPAPDQVESSSISTTEQTGK